MDNLGRSYMFITFGSLRVRVEISLRLSIFRLKQCMGTYFAMTCISQDDHLTAGAWAICDWI